MADVEPGSVLWIYFVSFKLNLVVLFFLYVTRNLR